jgi:hypothetical protein
MLLFNKQFKNIAAFVFMMNAVIVYAQPKIQFINTEVNVGEIYEGEMPEVKYVYKNVGNQPLCVTHVKSSCGCYTPSWEKDSTPPGGTDTIRARYSSVAHLGGISKSIYVVTNSGEKDIELMIRGSVKTFAPDLQLYYGGSDGSDFRVYKDGKTGNKSIVFHVQKEGLKAKSLALVFANKAEKEKIVSIVEPDSTRSILGLRVLRNVMSTSKLTYIPIDKFSITKADTEILYINFLKESDATFEVWLDTEMVNVSIVAD